MLGPAKFLSILSMLLMSLLLSACKQDSAKQGVRVPEVTVQKPVEQPVTKYLEYTGNTVALEFVDIRARVAGFLQKISFKPRAKVKAGELLFVIDPRQYEATVKEAQGKLDAQKASSKMAQTELQIAQQLESKEAISALKLEKQAAQRDAARAEVELAQADLDKAKLDLEWTQVTSPIDGRVSRNLVDVGNLVGATEKTLLTTVVNDSYIYAYFNIAELDLLPILRKFIDKEESIKIPKTVPVFMGLADEKGFPRKGNLDFADTKLDQGTGTIQVRGIFPNHDGLLMQGMFVRVRVPIEEKKALLIPEIAVQFDQGGKYVLVAGADDVVLQKRIKTGESVDDMRVVDEGLSTGDRVIVLGTQRARPGGKVKPTVSDTGPQKTGNAIEKTNQSK